MHSCAPDTLRHNRPKSGFSQPRGTAPDGETLIQPKAQADNHQIIQLGEEALRSQLPHGMQERVILIPSPLHWQSHTSPGTTPPGQSSHRRWVLHITLLVIDSDNKPKLLSSWIDDRSKHHSDSFTRGTRSSPLRMGPAGFSCRRVAPPRAPISLTCSCIPVLLFINMSLRDAIISPSHFISSMNHQGVLMRRLCESDISIWRCLV
jgi:hypothetical protein